MGVGVPSSLSSTTGELASPPSMAEPTELPLLPFLQSPPELHPCQDFGRRNAAVTESRLLPLLHVTSRAVALFPRSFATTAAECGCQSYCPASLSSINCGSSDYVRVSSVRLAVVAAEVRKIGVVVDVVANLELMVQWSLRF
ncbi:hypothetical protein PIB30_076798 [Stylosanthes scabra]|uniref:Uncharacterized protein n=1 Tax=Stylosanthes scabra TaxID=79078 RepID=A0ABU6RQR2_9FABA|nr:hypothetical protein [Stylosanthes scabra]